MCLLKAPIEKKALYFEKAQEVIISNVNMEFDIILSRRYVVGLLKW